MRFSLQTYGPDIYFLFQMNANILHTSKIPAAEAWLEILDTMKSAKSILPFENNEKKKPVPNPGGKNAIHPAGISFDSCFFFLPSKIRKSFLGCLLVTQKTSCNDFFYYWPKLYLNK